MCAAVMPAEGRCVLVCSFGSEISIFSGPLQCRANHTYIIIQDLNFNTKQNKFIDRTCLSMSCELNYLKCPAQYG